MQIPCPVLRIRYGGGEQGKNCSHPAMRFWKEALRPRRSKPIRMRSMAGHPTKRVPPLHALLSLRVRAGREAPAHRQTHGNACFRGGSRGLHAGRFAPWRRLFAPKAPPRRTANSGRVAWKEACMSSAQEAFFIISKRNELRCALSGLRIVRKTTKPEMVS